MRSAAPAATAAGASAGAAGGGGIGTAAVVGIVAGGAAIAGVAVAASGGGNDATTTTTVAVVVTPTTTTTTTTLAPAPPPTTLTPCPGCYAGNWQGQATLTAVANPPVCGQKSTDIGKVETFAIVIAPDGTITFQFAAGQVDATGAFMIALAGDPPGSGLTCPAGQIVGRCTSVTACAGNASQGGDLYNFVMTRPSP